ncbi:MAG: hypothetical protein K2X55_28455, partial [Burkholderiaceae bacterium]|nr:hypothetical protein [Burkholderiaceae bacterium]
QERRDNQAGRRRTVGIQIQVRQTARALASSSALSLEVSMVDSINFGDAEIIRKGGMKIKLFLKFRK